MSSQRISGLMGEIFEMYQPQTLAQSELENDGPYFVYGANGIIGRHSSYNHEGSQVLITCRGATCGTINVSQPFSWINGNAMVIKPRNSNVDLNWLKHYLQSGLDIKRAITGAAQPQITRQSLSLLKVSIPPLAEQQRIAAILDKAEEIKLKREMAIEKLDSLAQSMFVDMFGDSHSELKIYPTVKLGEVCEIIMGQAPSGDSYNENNNGYPLIAGAGDFKNGVINAKKYTTAPTKLSKEDDIVMSIRASIGEKVWADKDFCLGRGVTALRPNKNLDRKYLWHALTEVEPELIRKGRGATFLQVSKDDIKDLVILLPPLNIQIEFANKIKKLETIKKANFNASRLAAQEIASIQSQAFSGQL